MINHTYTEPAELNFSKLEERIMKINDPKWSKANDMRELLYQLSIENKPTLLMATGGSKVVAYYLQSIIERLGFTGTICEVMEPRDFFYKTNVNQFSNLIAISAGGKTQGIEEALLKFAGNKFLICETDQKGHYQVVSWGNREYEKERSFISLASSLGPMALMLNATMSLNMEIGSNEIKKVNEKISQLFQKCLDKMNHLPTNFKHENLIQIMSGYDTKSASKVLESNVIEAGLGACVVHDKGSFCHGRSNLMFHYPNSQLIYLCHQKAELDEALIRLLCSEYPNISIFETEDLEESFFWKEYYLLLQMYFLSKKIAEDKKMDLTQPEYHPQIVKKLYEFKGAM